MLIRLNTPWHGITRSFGTSYGSLVYHQRSETLYGERALTYFPLELISFAGKSLSLSAVCGQVDETVSHALWECPLAYVWALVKGRLQKCGAVSQNFHLLDRQMEAKPTGKELELWAMVAWPIWNARNRLYFEATQFQPSDILREATTLLQDYQRLNRHLSQP